MHTKVFTTFPDIFIVSRVCVHIKAFFLSMYPSAVDIQHTQCPVPALSLHTINRYRYKLSLLVTAPRATQRDTYCIVLRTW